MEKFANEGGMISEQIMGRRRPAGKGHETRALRPARPCRCAGRMRNTSPWCAALMTACALIESNRHSSATWSNPVRQPRTKCGAARHPLRRMPRGKILRIILAAEANVVWSADGWASTNKTEPSPQRAECVVRRSPDGKLPARFRDRVHFLLERCPALGRQELFRPGLRRKNADPGPAAQCR